MSFDFIAISKHEIHSNKKISKFKNVYVLLKNNAYSVPDL